MVKRSQQKIGTAVDSRGNKKHQSQLAIEIQMVKSNQLTLSPDEDSEQLATKVL